MAGGGWEGLAGGLEWGEWLEGELAWRAEALAREVWLEGLEGDVSRTWVIPMSA